MVDDEYSRTHVVRRLHVHDHDTLQFIIPQSQIRDPMFQYKFVRDYKLL